LIRLFIFKVEKFHTVNGQSVAVKKALPKDGGMGGRGGRRGGGMMGGFARNDNFDGDFTGGQDPGNFAMMAQKMFQAAAMGNFAGNKRMGGPRKIFFRFFFL
jgi:hypothetical protein